MLYNMHVGIVGFGAIGTLLAARLSNYCKISVFRRPNKTSVASDIVKIKIRNLDGTVSTSGPIELHHGIWDDLKEPIDIALLTVKHKDIHEASSLLAKATEKGLFTLKSTTPKILSLQNGIGNVEAIEKAFTDRELKAEIIAGVTYLGARKNLEPSKLLEVDQTGGGSTHFAKSILNESQTLEKLAELMNQASLPTILEESVESILWTKLLVNCVINPLTALCEVENGKLAEFREFDNLIDPIIEEFLQVFSFVKPSVKLNTNGLSPKEYVLSVAQATSKNVSSMLRDIQEGRETETSAINGALVEVAKSNSLEEPKTHKLLHDLVRAKSVCFQYLK